MSNLTPVPDFKRYGCTLKFTLVLRVVVTPKACNGNGSCSNNTKPRHHFCVDIVFKFEVYSVHSAHCRHREYKLLCRKSEKQAFVIILDVFVNSYFQIRLHPYLSGLPLIFFWYRTVLKYIQHFCWFHRIRKTALQ